MPEQTGDYSWIPATLEQLNAFYDKAPLVVSICLLLVCATPFAAAIALPLFAWRRSQNQEVDAVASKVIK